MSQIIRQVASVFMYAVYLAVFVLAGSWAYNIRTKAITEYGLVIHEFDPWFNFRATQYLADHGWKSFFTWFDYESWYPLGRPVGTTIYPGMQIASVGIWKALGMTSSPMSLNDVCVYVPVWFGVIASVFLGLLTRECSGSWAAGAAGALIFSVIPAHIMRSVGGGYDNESVAMTCMTATFYFWVRSLRHDPKITDGSATRDSYVYGVITALAYICMVAAWGGFVFVLNMIGMHAALLVATGRYSSKLHRAYSLFFVIGTLGAMQVPVVGWNPLRSLEQLAPLFVFLAFQLLEYVEIQRREKALSIIQTFFLRVKVFIPFAVGLALVLMVLYPMGYFGPLSARVRGLFVKHTRTGNPLVDSVAEHQPASESAYQQYLGHIYYIAPFGFVISLLRFNNDSNLFIIAYAVVAYFFSSKMARLIILLGPVASAHAGALIGFVVDQMILKAFGGFILSFVDTPVVVKPAPAPVKEAEKEAEKTDKKNDKKKNEKTDKKNDKKKNEKKSQPVKKSVKKVSLAERVEKLKLQANNGSQVVVGLYNSRRSSIVRLMLGLWAMMLAYPKTVEFYDSAHTSAERFSHPQIMYKANLRDGSQIMLDDYREAYWWLRDTTPQDSRVMAWWDYGYQIAGIANRTTIADGNTWNHEHIATLGKVLSAPEADAYKIARHLADYVLVWAGGGGDDLAKSPHMARIGNSVFGDICPNDPTCSKFGFYSGGVPTSMMKESLLYKCVKYGTEGVMLDPKRFTHAYTSTYGKVRIFKVTRPSQKSKKWIADPANRVCDKPGSWYCPGQYPPALQELIASRKSFAQLEDFNRKKDAASTKYNQQYMDAMEGKKGRRSDSKEDKVPELKMMYLGCVEEESHLGGDKTYGGGVSGVNSQLALQFAKDSKKRFVAMSRATNEDGHSFAFNTPVDASNLKHTTECGGKCTDTSDAICGCADAFCGGSIAPGPDGLKRRWALYDVEPNKAPKAKKTKKKKKKKKEL